MKSIACRLVMIAAAATLGGCLNLRAYDGPKQRGDEVAVVKGDYKVRAGAPMSLLLRKVDDQTVDVRYSAVEVLPGTHTFLIDCKLTEAGSTTRHSVETQVEAGVKYRIVGETGSGNRSCENVHLEALN